MNEDLCTEISEDLKPLTPSKTSQLERMDLNIASGKNSLFINNKEEDLIDPSYSTAIHTNYGSKLLLSFAKEKFLGEGRYSKVFKGLIRCKSTTTWREVAVKLAFKDYEAIESLQHEQKLLSQLSSPHMVPIEDSFTLHSHSEFECGYAMPLAEFGTLESFIVSKDVFSLSFSLFLSWSKQLVEMLKVLEAAGITHFDIKPQNILVMGDYTLRLGDFGDAVISLTPDFEEIRGRGTLHYNAPELLSLRSVGPCDGMATDMYSVGLILYSLFTGRSPWMELHGPRTHQLLTCKKGFFAGTFNPLPSPGSVDDFKLPGPNGEILLGPIVEHLSRLIIDCTASDPEKRISADEALRRLNESCT